MTTTTTHPPHAEAIRATLARHVDAARLRTPFGVLSTADLAGIFRRTALECGVTVDAVKEAANG